MRFQQKRSGFTLIELLTVIGIIALIAAILFPVFAQVRHKSYETTCVSNLRQLGMAFAMYAQDYDGKFAYGGDPTDTNTNAWDYIPGADGIKTIQPLPLILNPYAKSREVWHCPADTGLTMAGPYEGIPLDATPTSYQKYGMSYYYRTAFALGGHPFGTHVMYGSASPYKEYGPSEIGYLYDGSGKWHGGSETVDHRYDSLYVDGHAKNIDQETFACEWAMQYSRPAK